MIKLKLKVQLKQILKEKNMTQKELAEKTGLKPSVISEIANNQRSAINRNYIELIAAALEITDIKEILTLAEE